ncbi:hypothetical protein ID866_9193 [Astraeus odoratus]|nr:hypothetical protein ID866_9193 [Astraeus odoratus]
MTPTTSKGKSVQCAKQDGPSDPTAALHNHLCINPAPSKCHLFTWRHRDRSLCPLTQRQFLSCLSNLANHLCLPGLRGHSLHIGGTLEYLLRGVLFEVVQAQDHWAGKAFLLYLQKHTMILAPYLQASPASEPFTRYMQPPIC